MCDLTIRRAQQRMCVSRNDLRSTHSDSLGQLPEQTL